MNKLELLVGNEKPLFLGADISISLVRQNNFWREEVELVFEYSEPFDIPYCEQNAAILGFPENVNSRKPPTYDAVYKRNDSLRLRGRLVVLNASYNRYTIALVRSQDLDLDKKIVDIVSGIWDAPNTETEIPAQVALGVDNPFNWPQVAEFDPDQVEKFKIDEDWNFTYINYYHGTAEHFDVDTPLVPMFFMPYVLRKVFAFYSINIVSSWLSHGKITNKMLFNTNSINVQGSYPRKLILNMIFSAQFDAIFLYIETPYDGVDYEDFRPFVGDTITLNIHRFNKTTLAFIATDTINYTVQPTDIGDVPAFLGNLFIAIQTFDPNYVLFQTQTGTVNPGIYVGYAVTGVYQIVSNHAGLANNAQNIVPQKIAPAAVTYVFNPINIKNHLPDITAAQFITAISDAFCLAVFMDPYRNQAYITPKKDLLVFEWVDLTAYILANPDITPRDNPNYRILFETDDYAVYPTFPTLYNGKVTLNDGHDAKDATEINIELGRPNCPSPGPDNGDAGYGTMPVTEREIGDYDALVTIPLRLITWRGLTIDSDGYDYPKADDSDLHPNTLYNDWWKNWLIYKNSDYRKMRAQFRMPPEVLNAIDPRHRWRLHGIDHIWIDITETDTIHDTTIEANLARI
jgi:hypothetical protein